jgi:hypothetical protein
MEGEGEKILKMKKKMYIKMKILRNNDNEMFKIM